MAKRIGQHFRIAMSWRTVIIQNRAKLDYKMGYMVVRGEETKRVLIDEISILVIENPAVALTGCLIEALIEKKVKVIFCDAKRNPVAELVSHHGSHDSSLKINKVKPPKGLVQLLTVTEKQFSKMEFIVGENHNETIDTDERIVIL